MVISGIVGITVYSILWRFMYASQTECTPQPGVTLVWGGTAGSASARWLIPVLTSTYAGFYVLCLLYYTAKKKDSENPFQRWLRMNPYKNYFINFVLTCASVLVMFLAGYIVAVLGSPSANALFEVYGCTSMPQYWWWLSWTGAATFLIIALCGHLMIPSGDWRALDKLPMNWKMVFVSAGCSIAACVLLAVAFGKQQSGEDFHATNNTDVCNCTGATNATLCETARQALWDVTTDSSGGTWVCVISAGMIFLFTISIGGALSMKKTRTSVAMKWIRTLLIVTSAVIVILVGYAAGGTLGAPRRDLTDACCGISGACKTLPNTNSYVLILVASILWCCSCVTGHAIKRARVSSYEKLIPKSWT